MGGIGGRAAFKWRQPAHHQQGPHFGPHSTAKTNLIKAHSSGRKVSSGISD